MQGTQFAGTLRIEKNFKNIAYILATSDGLIDGISSCNKNKRKLYFYNENNFLACISLLRLDLKVVTQKKNNMNDIIPNIMNEKDNYMVKGGANLLFKFLKDQNDNENNDGSSIFVRITL